MTAYGLNPRYGPFSAREVLSWLLILSIVAVRSYLSPAYDLRLSPQSACLAAFAVPIAYKL